MSDDLIDWFKEADGFCQGTKAPHKWVLQAHSEIIRLQARLADLETKLGEVEAQLATARRDGMEAVARWHDGKAVTIGHIMVKQTREEEMHRTCAAAIRALAQEGSEL